MNGTSISGILICIVALAFGAFGHLLLEKESNVLFAAKTYASEDPVGTEVLIEGKVTDNNDLLVHQFVHAKRETYQEASGSMRSYWKTREQFNQPLQLSTGAEDVVLVVDTPVVRGKDVMTFVDPSNSGNRWRGIGRGTAVTAVGTIISSNPVTIEAEVTFAGDRESYAADLAFGRRSLFITIGIALLIGIAIIAYGVKKR